VLCFYTALNAIGAEQIALLSTTSATPAIQLGVAGEFAILSETGITDVYPSVVVGDVGTSPITGAALLLQCSEVTGNVYTVNAAGPACSINDASFLGTAIGDMLLAYNNAASVNNQDYFDLGAGSIGGMTLQPGVYNWASSVLITADLYIAGMNSSSDRWVFQIDGTLDLSNGIMIHLSSGAMPNNIVWQVAGAVTLGTTSHFEGVILGKTAINLQTGATVNGRLLAQTAVTLQMNTVVQPQD